MNGAEVRRERSGQAASMSLHEGGVNGAVPRRSDTILTVESGGLKMLCVARDCQVTARAGKRWERVGELSVYLASARALFLP